MGALVLCLLILASYFYCTMSARFAPTRLPRAVEGRERKKCIKQKVKWMCLKVTSCFSLCNCRISGVRFQFFIFNLNWSYHIHCELQGISPFFTCLIDLFGMFFADFCINNAVSHRPIALYTFVSGQDLTALGTWQMQLSIAVSLWTCNPA